MWTSLRYIGKLSNFKQEASRGGGRQKGKGQILCTFLGRFNVQTGCKRLKSMRRYRKASGQPAKRPRRRFSLAQAENGGVAMGMMTLAVAEVAEFSSTHKQGLSLKTACHSRSSPTCGCDNGYDGASGKARRGRTPVPCPSLCTAISFKGGADCPLLCTNFGLHKSIREQQTFRIP